MEERNFWDELANRLRQEQPQSFQEEDWAAVHGRLRRQRKRRVAGAWFWPAAAVFLFLINNLVWWQLWRKQDLPAVLPSHRQDTVFLIRERVLRDTVWLDSSHSAFILNQKKSVEKDIIKQGPDQEPGKKTLENEVNRWENDAATIPVIPVIPKQPDLRTPLEDFHALPPAPAGLIVIPPRIHLTPARPLIHPTPARKPEFWLETDAGYGRFAGSDAFVRQFGASVSLLPASWGFTVGARAWHAGENPDKTAAKLGLPDSCETCPAAGFPTRVRLQWLEFQFGPVYRLPWLKGRTSLYLSALGHLRGRAKQYRHFYFEQYGPSPPIEVDDHYREKAGLYWNGCSAKLSATHRLTPRLVLYGALEGRWPAGVNPRLTPASAGLNLGLAWYFRN